MLVKPFLFAYNKNIRGRAVSVAGKGKPMTKSLEELTIVDDFMFGAVMRNPKLCKPLLELILTAGSTPLRTVAGKSKVSCWGTGR